MKIVSNLIAAFLIASGSSSAAVTLADMGTTAPTIYNTGHLGTLDNRTSFDGPSDSHGQSFTTATTGTLEYLHIAYNAGGMGSFQVFIDAAYAGGGSTEIISDATTAATFFTINLASFVPSTNGLSGSSTDTNSGPGYWFRLNFTNEAIALTAGQQAAFFFRAVSETASDSNFIFAPRYHLNDQVGETDEYLGGSTINGSGFAPAGSGHDFGFAVTVIPEPSTAWFGALAPLALLRRRRKSSSPRTIAEDGQFGLLRH
jgi:hypothetical protein